MTAGAVRDSDRLSGTDASPLRLAIVGPTYPLRGGIAQYTTLLCRALGKKHDVRFFSLSRQYPGIFFPGKSQYDYSNTSMRVDNDACLDSINPVSWWRTARKIRRYRPDLAIFSWWHPFFAPSYGTVARLARRLGGPPSCFLCHNAVPHESTVVDRLLLRYGFASPQVFIAHSAQDRDELLRIRPDAIVHCNPHPTYDVFSADSAVTPAQAKATLGLEGRRVLLFFGYVREYKGLDYLLEAMLRLGPDHDYHLLIVGEFYEKSEKYQASLDQLSSRGQLTLVDRYVPNEEVAQYFAASDLVVVPYLSATQSGVVQIAYAFSKPVVATRVGGLPEVVTDGVTGYLVPPADAEAIAAAVRRYFDEDSAEELRRNIEAENDKYSWERMVETVERACAELSR